MDYQIIDEKVLEKMMPYLTDSFGNASSMYEIGRKNKDLEVYS